MKKTSANIMKVMGATIAVCSAAALMTSTKSNSQTAKKAMQKTVDKVAGFVDTMTSMM
ncbi:MAG: hypothetical protein NC213_01310 [Acetobacter sp.]|nr:hypothetical protein [Bacteroides sp.]MCM1340364.1 hypothetical protein [Acetobacter sp.]MCM1432989.1 hypothetical protein [Clostridiales bacterium]